MGRGALLHENDARRQDRVSRRELQRKFTPGCLGVWGATMFTLVGWTATVTGDRPAGWAVVVLVGQSLATWDWTHLKQCETVQEWVEKNAVP